LEKFITNYLVTQEHFSWKTVEDSRNFCVIENLDPTNNIFPFYLWVRCSEFVIENNELKEASGSSGPTKIIYPNELSYFDSNKISYETPADGSQYSKDIKLIFPLNIQKIITDSHNLYTASTNKKLQSIAQNSFGDTYNPTYPDTFNFIFKYGVNAKNELNTFDQTYTKDMIVDPSITIKFQLTENELTNIYHKMNNLKLFNKYEIIEEEITMTVTPCSSYYLKVQINYTEKELSWDDCQGRNKFQEFTDYVIEIIKSKEEYKNLPEPKSGYI